MFPTDAKKPASVSQRAIGLEYTRTSSPARSLRGMKDKWESDHQFVEGARRSQRWAERELESLQSTIQETRRVLEASRKLLEKIAEREDHTQP
ncbi:hypothetical protein X766_24385 [Mesorhizobium sp. LSJC255A00]|nr:hypothetical protein X766_24385 [Mesorhizobium sp. LSJC255A00]